MSTAIEWIDDFYDSSNRKVLTSKQINISGIETFGYNVNHKAAPPLCMHYHKNCIEITYVIKGNVCFVIDDCEYKLYSGDTFITYPNEVHSTGSNPLGTSEIYWLQLDISSCKNFLNLSTDWSKEIIYAFSHIQNRVIKSQYNLKNLLKSSFNLIIANNLSHNYQACVHLLQFFYQIIEADQQTTFSFTSDINQAIEYIICHITEDIILEDVAKICHLSLSRFKQKFKFELGVTPREFINRHKIELAKTYLLQHDSVTSTALALGFSTSNYFCVVFRKFTGYSPSEYIQLNNK